MTSTLRKWYNTTTLEDINIPQADALSAKCILNVFYRPMLSTVALVEGNRDWFIPIHGGHTTPQYHSDWMRDNLIGDDTGENISAMNPTLNEHTAIYWVWKNYSNPEVGDPEWIGFNHYRRYFLRSKVETILRTQPPDFIVASTYRFKVSVLAQYAHFHIVDDLYTLLSVMPKDDEDMFRKYLDQTSMFAPLMSFMMRKADFFAWCEYAFPIMFDLYDILDLSHRSTYQRRAICFLMERLFGFWVAKRIDLEKRIAVAIPMIFDQSAKSPEITRRELTDADGKDWNDNCKPQEN